jgi:hypothetical protein
MAHGNCERFFSQNFHGGKELQRGGKILSIFFYMFALREGDGGGHRKRGEKNSFSRFFNI